jgi:hypothetical protein
VVAYRHLLNNRGVLCLHCKRVTAIRHGVLCISTPIPLFLLIKNHIPGHMYLLGCWIICTVCLGPRLIVDEDHWLTPIFKLFQIQGCVLDMNNTPKRGQVVDSWLVPVLVFERCLALNTFGR